MKVRVRATYSTIEFQDGREDPIESHGYTNPKNPWGGFMVSMDGDAGPHNVTGASPEGRQAQWDAWLDENVETVVLDSPWEAAEFVNNFPGGVWDYQEGESEQQADGKWKEVTLHVVDHVETVFALADYQSGKGPAL